MDVIGVKVFSGFLFFFLALFFGWLPFWVLRRCLTSGAPPVDRNKNLGGGTRVTVIQYLHSLASGVLIATCLVNLLPESLESVKDAMRTTQNCKDVTPLVDEDPDGMAGNVSLRDFDERCKNNDDLYPVGELVLALGFLFIYIVDSLIQAVNSRAVERKRGNRSKHNSFVYKKIDQHSLEEDAFSNTLNDTNPESLLSRSAENKSPSLKTSPGEHNHCSSTDIEPSRLDIKEEIQDVHRRQLRFSDEIHPLIEVQEGPAFSGRSHRLRSVALVTALCVHGFFDGIMLGLQTSVNVLLSLLLALSLHKSFVSMSLSLTLFKNHKDSSVLMILLYVFLFAAAAPLGLVLSAALVHTAFDSYGNDVSLIPGCLQAFAVGTFMYVTFTETTRHRDITSLTSQIVGHVFLITGFVLMAGLRSALGKI